MKIICLALLFFASQVCFACTTFLLRSKDQLVFGRNYDWITGEGVLNSNQRGLYKISSPVKDGKTISWTSKYGSLTFNQYGKEFPTGGMNEKGLVVELMWLEGTQYPAKDDRAALNVLQWIQYQLDNYSTVEEVILSDSILRITGKGTPLHYLVADANGKAATIEFLEGKMVAQLQAGYPVLTNHTYTYSFDQMVNGRSRSNNSLERFATTCAMVKHSWDDKSKVSVDNAFNILSKVSQGSFTKWSIAYDITNKQIYFKTEGHQDIKTISFQDLDLSCDATPKSFVLNQDIKGNIRDNMVSYTSSINEKSLRTAFKESALYINATEEEIAALISYAKQVACK
jgi:penicillin V acylase-like amidase (Ntn superfamily)